MCRRREHHNCNGQKSVRGKTGQESETSTSLQSMDKNQNTMSTLTLLSEEGESHCNSPIISPHKRRHFSASEAGATAAKKSKTQADLISMLTCPVCEELPRSGSPIFGCRNGHVLCQACVDKVEHCPVCREKDVRCRSMVSEQIIATTLKNVYFPCKFQDCKVRMAMKELTEHERFCAYRDVPCPSIHRKACQWRGPLVNLVKHMKEKKCVQVILENGMDLKASSPTSEQPSTSAAAASATQDKPAVFRSNIGDFPTTSASVFQRSDAITHWKPVVLLSKSILNLWCHVLIQRGPSGIWHMVVYGMIPKDCVNDVQVKITVGGNNSDSTYTFSGKMVSYETTFQDALKTGRFLSLHDSQVNPFKMPNQSTIFHYSVEIHAKPELLERMNKSAPKAGTLSIKQEPKD